MKSVLHDKGTDKVLKALGVQPEGTTMSKHTEKPKRLGAKPGEDLEAINQRNAPYVIRQTGNALAGWSVQGPGQDCTHGGGSDGGWVAAKLDAAHCACVFRQGQKAANADLLAACKRLMQAWRGELVGRDIEKAIDAASEAVAHAEGH